MRPTVMSVIMYLPSLLAFSAATLSSTTEEAFSRNTPLAGRALAAGTAPERASPRSASTEGAEQRAPLASKGMTATTPSRHGLSGRSGVTGVVKFRGRTVGGDPWKGPTETPHATSGQGATAARNLGTRRGATAGDAEAAVGWQGDGETSPAPGARRSAHAGSAASADARRTAAAHDSATEARDRDPGRTDDETDPRKPRGKNTTGGASQPECGKRGAKPAPLSKSTKLVCFVTLWTLGATASVLFGLTLFLWVRLAVHRGEERRTRPGAEPSALWAQPKGTLEQRVEFWYAGGPSAAREQAAVGAQPPRDAAGRSEPRALWTPPRVTLEDITEFWYSNGRTRPRTESSDVREGRGTDRDRARGREQPSCHRPTFGK